MAKLFTRLRLRINHLLEHKFTRSFQDTLNQICSCGKEVETTSHVLLSCPNYSDEKSTVLSKTRNINPNILENTISKITQFFLYGGKDFTTSTNFIVLNLTVEYILLTKRFGEPVFV